MQRRMGCGDGQARQEWEHSYRCRKAVPGTWPCRRRPSRQSTHDIEVSSRVCPTYAIQDSHSHVTKLSDLDGIEGALKECAEASAIKRFFLRADMLKRVKKYDAKLSNVLQNFQVCPLGLPFASCRAYIERFPIERAPFGRPLFSDCREARGMLIAHSLWQQLTQSFHRLWS